MGLKEVITYPSYTFYNFVYIFMFLLLVGGLYGILKHIKAYRRFLDKVVNIIKDAEILYTVIFMILLTVIVSFTGLTYEVLAIMPLVASIVLLLGRDKISVGLIALGPIAVGIIGNLFASSVVGTLVNSLGIEANNLLLFRIILLFVGIGFNILFVILHNKKVKEDADREFYFIPEPLKEDEKVSVWPLATILGVFAFIKVLACIPWQSIFNISLFANLKEAIDAYPLFSKLVGFIIFGLIIIGILVKYLVKAIKYKETNFIKAVGKCGLVFLIISSLVLFIIILKVLFEDLFNITRFFTNIYNGIGLDKVTIGTLLGETAAIGAWTYAEHIVYLIILEVILMWVYHIKPDELVENNGKGMKKVLYATLVSMFAYVMLVATTNNPVMLTILKPIINVISNTTVPLFKTILYLFVSLVSAFMNSDMAYFSYSVFPTTFAANTFANSNVLPLMAILHQGAVGLALLIAPTSVPMLFTIGTLNLSYKEWFKKAGLLFLVLLGWLITLSIGVLLYLSL